MPVPSIVYVQDIMADHESTLGEVMRGAWSDVMAMQHAFGTTLYARTRANLMFDFFARRATTAFAGHPQVRVIHGEETLCFVISQALHVRVKKADHRGVGSNIATQRALDIVDPQSSLPGIGDMPKAEIVYFLDSSETMIDKIEVITRDGASRPWGYELREGGAELLPFPVTPTPRPPVAPAADAVVSFRDRGEASVESGGE